jgi:uncharacterized damage-inducible protein DinB
MRPTKNRTMACILSSRNQKSLPILMSDKQSTSERYPLGTFQCPNVIDERQRSEWIDDLHELPARVASAIAGLNEEQLDTPYRQGGWTVRQVVHHLPDSHINAYTRLRLALTEDNPTIRPYQEDRWAELADARSGPLTPSLQILEGLHARWTALLRSLDASDFERTFYHPELKEMRLDRALGLYAWHSRHHVAQVTALRNKMGW